MTSRGVKTFFAKRVARSLPVLWLLIVVCLRGLAQSSRERGHVEGGAPISVERVKQLRENVDAWPLIVHPTNAAEQRINETLANLNRKFAKRVQDCISGKFAWSKGFNEGEWGRTVKVTMQGPRFLSMVASDDFYCGTAHPDDDLVVLVFNIEIGEQVDWSALVGKSAGASLSKNELGDEDGTPPLMLPELQATYAAADKDYCKDDFEDERSFVLWPDAESGTLVAEVAGLPHVALPCKNELKLTIEQSRNLGFDESLLQAIEEAHRIAVVGSKVKPVRKQPAPTSATPPNSR
ncbi:MAG: hypothetical protein WCA10_19550 [Terracidiphilus sp.]